MKIKKLFFSIALSSSILFSGCYGSFTLVTAVHGWNGSASDNKFVQEVLFLGLCIIPVYEVAAFLDVIILNTVEFWTGTNPMAMKEGDREIQYVRAHGKKYEIVATKNRFDIREECGNEEISLIYHPEETAWYMESKGCSNKLSQFEVKNNRKFVKQFLPDGKISRVEI